MIRQKKMFFALLVISVMMIQATAFPLKAAEVDHFPVVSGIVCEHEGVFQVEVNVVAWDGETKAENATLFVTLDSSILISDVVSVPSKSIYMLAEAPDYLQVTVWAWEDGFTGGTSGGGLTYSQDCQSPTAIDEVNEPTNATLEFGNFLFSTDLEAKLKNDYDLEEDSFPTCKTVIALGDPVGSVYDFSCETNRIGTEFVRCYTLKDSPISVSDYGLTDGRKKISGRLMITGSYSQPINFWCHAHFVGSAPSAPANSTHITMIINGVKAEKDLTIINYLYLQFLATIAR